MDLLHSYLALLFQLLLLLCGCGIYAVKDLRENQGNGFHGTAESVKGSSQLAEELKDLYFHPKLSHQIIKELEHKYSSVANWRYAVNINSDLSFQLAKELEDKYSSVANWRSSAEKKPELSYQLVKELEDKYSSAANWRSSIDRNPELSSQLAKELENKYSSLSNLRYDVENNRFKSSSPTVKGMDDKYSIVVNV